MLSKQQKRLDSFYSELEEASSKMQSAIRVAQEAERELSAKRARFEAAVEFVGGAGATFTYSAETGVVVTEAAPAQEGKQAPVLDVLDGAGPAADVKPKFKYNHKARREALRA